MAVEASAERILIVDDEPAIRAVCRQAFENAGYFIIDAPDGKTALQHLDRGVFAAAVLDIVLPDTDGLQLLREIKQRDESIVVVLITGFASLETAMDAVRLGAYEYVRKPFGAGDLVRIIERGIESQRLKGRNDELLAELQQANATLLRQHEQIQARIRLATEDLMAFVELGRRLSEDGGLAEKLRALLRAGMQVAHACAAAVYRLDISRGELVGVLAVGLPSADVEQAVIPLSDGLLAGVAADGRDRIENELLAGAIADDEHLGFLGVQSVLAVPLSHGDGIIGVMAFFDHEEGVFPEGSPDLVRVLSAQASQVISELKDPPAGPDDTQHDGFVDLTEVL